ncbi:hypothetical protein SAMN02745751_03168 [Dethiosulfatibacter aminovorans DSM 17477]|uniref:Uncharacterized protein n=1 Tax=Dethiosulfatibacter aminovorans DSM 17477 TaxID=1121476 RepID=A0A1M6LGW9_9FIRM|nr:sigma-70 family RNA polymerase sigma factor [Dethiosulfatibacter aminovorans]SHJ70378.1 hypothetical protein SAMN02745751_03168 [Dethiosulfatibacter aminovorans DSM 17477]
MTSRKKLEKDFKKVDLFLRKYIPITREIKFCQEQLYELESEDMDTLRAYNPSGVRVQTSNIFNAIEDAVIRKEIATEELNSQIMKLAKKKDKIDKFIEWLNYDKYIDRYTVIRKYYCNDMRTSEIAKDMGITISTVSKIKKLAIRYLINVYDDSREVWDLI